jgi:hypothetical protein
LKLKEPIGSGAFGKVYRVIVSGKYLYKEDAVAVVLSNRSSKQVRATVSSYGVTKIRVEGPLERLI